MNTSMLTVPKNSIIESRDLNRLVDFFGVSGFGCSGSLSAGKDLLAFKYYIAENNILIRQKSIFLLYYSGIC